MDLISIAGTVWKVWKNPLFSGGRLWLMPNETAPSWMDGDPGYDPNNIANYYKDEDGWYQYLGDPDKEFDGYWVRPVDEATKQKLEEALEIIDRRKGDANRNGIPDILEGARDRFGDARNTTSPIILDLDGDGIETTAVNGWANFDHDGNGFAESTGWVGRDDGLLVRDLDGNGRINSGQELFGSETLLANGSKAANGFVALAELDSNGDGKIDSNDSAWTTLKIWRDTDEDGYTSDGELLTLEEAGVQSLNVAYTNSSSVDANGNQHKQLGSYTKTDGTVAAATDVWFNIDRLNSIAKSWLEVPEDVAGLPDVRGYGNVFDLHQAIVRDTTGQLQQLVEQFSVAATKAERESLIDSIIIHWAGAQNIAAGSRGSYIDAKKLTALEAFMGEGLGKNPGSNAAPIALSAYNDLKEYVYNQLTAQTALKPFYNAIDYRFDSESQTVKLEMAGVIAVVSELSQIDLQVSLELFSEFAPNQWGQTPLICQFG